MFKNVFLAISLLCAVGSFNVNAAAGGVVTATGGYFFQELTEGQKETIRTFYGIAMINGFHKPLLFSKIDIQDLKQKGIFLTQDDLEFAAITCRQNYDALLNSDRLFQIFLQLQLACLIDATHITITEAKSLALSEIEIALSQTSVAIITSNALLTKNPLAEK